MPDWCNGLVAFSYPYQNSQWMEATNQHVQNKEYGRNLFQPKLIMMNDVSVDSWPMLIPELMFLRMRFALSCGLSWAIWLMRCCIVFGNLPGNFLNCWPLLVPCWRFTSTTPGSWAFALARWWVYCVLIFQHKVGKSATVRCRNICDTLTQFHQVFAVCVAPLASLWVVLTSRALDRLYGMISPQHDISSVRRCCEADCVFPALLGRLTQCVMGGHLRTRLHRGLLGKRGPRTTSFACEDSVRSMSLSGFMKRTCLTRRKQPEVVAERSDVGMTAIATLRVPQAPFRWSLNQTILKSGTWFHGTIIKHRCFAFLFLTETNSEAL